ncbi:MAG: Proline--tRNA ligase [Syntrophus sp. PtaB.Bin001]|nr:MAG: Proline--tRNA ligase [Syntrophus sp. PtaB.Bin001]
MRCREFGMKDAYSFDADEESAELSYQKMFEAYQRIFARCGLGFRPVEADSGTIGGSFSHEFMVMADSGEDGLVFCSSCSYAANLEKAEVHPPEKIEVAANDMLPLEEVHTPNVRTIDEVSAFLNVTPQDIVKTLIFNADGVPVAVLIRGDEEVNEIKVKNYLGCQELELAMDDMIQNVTGAPRGFAGAVGIKSRVIADYSLMNMKNVVMGANKEDYHIRNVNEGRDFKIAAFADLKVARETDYCPRCRKSLQLARGIEVGHVFKLGTKYSKAMGASYLDSNGKEQTMIMGCYGIGIGRTVAACIEQNHDENGIIWPMPIAPFQVIITPVNMNDKNLADTADRLYGALIEKGVEVLLDDRDERAGVKFKDADLIGIPIRVTIGPKKLAEGKVEIRLRDTGEVTSVLLDQIEDTLLHLIEEKMGDLSS